MCEFYKKLLVAFLVLSQKRTYMHDDPERRAFAQPRRDVAARAGCEGPARLTHHADTYDESHVRNEVVRCEAQSISET